MNKTDEKIPLKEKIFYGSGEIYGGGSSTLISIVLLVFFTSVLGISPLIGGTIIMVSKIWDAISDPLMGVISDNTRSKFGRRKPYIVLGGILTLLAMLFLFSPIAGADMWFKITFSTVAYIFYCTANTVSQVPYCSLSSDISPNYKERNKANAIKLVFSMASAAFCYLVPSMLIDSLRSGNISITQFYLVMGIGFGLFFAIPLILAGIFTKERVQYDKEVKAKFSFKSYIKPFKVKSFSIHLIMYIGVFVCMDIVSAIAVYYATDVLRGMTIFGKPMSSLYIIAPMTLAIFCMLPVVLTLAKKKSKQFALRFALPCYVAGGIALALTPVTAPSFLVPLFAFIMGIGFAGAQSMPWIIFPDTVDIAQLKYGDRDTGSFSGIMTFLRKMSNAVAIWLVGMILQFSGLIPGSADNMTPVQPLSALLAVRILFAVAILVLITIVFIASLKYKVTDKKLDRVKYFIEAKENLTDDERAEKSVLISELAGKEWNE